VQGQVTWVKRWRWGRWENVQADIYSLRNSRRFGRRILWTTCCLRSGRHVRWEVVQVESGRESEVLNLWPLIIAARSHSSERRLRKGARKRLRRYLEYSSDLSRSIWDEFASYERRLAIVTLVQNHDWLPTGCLEGNIGISTSWRTRQRGIELGRFMGWILCNWTSFSHSAIARSTQRSTQWLPRSS